MAPATVALLLLGVDGAARQPGWSGRPRCCWRSPSTCTRWRSRPRSGPPPQQPWRVFLRLVTEDARTALAQTALQLTFLASQAWDRAHAIGLTLVRLAATQRRLLEWETAAASAARGTAAAAAPACS